MNKKAAIELSINMLVVIIISLVILGSGVALLYKFMGQAGKMEEQLDQRTKDELRRLLIDQGRQVAISLRTATIQRGESQVFGLGILNSGGVGDQFQMEIELASALDPQEEEISLPAAGGWETWFLYEKDFIVIEENSHYPAQILVTPAKTAPPGKYIFKLRVKLPDGNQYGNTQNLIVEVI